MRGRVGYVEAMVDEGTPSETSVFFFFVSMIFLRKGPRNMRGGEWTHAADQRIEERMEGFVVVLFILLSLPLVRLVSRAASIVELLA